ncbi:MAG: ABC transporter ATP-binding protein [Gammaproteobacteria bacterium]|tara:strand:+ start:3165 stop:3836 length:672 start_codon:yes stop_codon:yes gene_type:complete
MFLSCENLDKTYQNNSTSMAEHVLKNINLNIEKGVLAALRGPSGSGKSTLLNLIAGLDYPSSGKVIFNNIVINNLNNSELAIYRNKNISIIFQFFNLLNDLTVYENIALPLIIRGEKRKQISKKVLPLIEEIGLMNRKNFKTNILSGGESQRVAIARSLVTEPKLILADEPTGNLDKSNTDMILDLLINSCKSTNSTLLMVTHDIDLLKKFDKVYTLESGIIS